MAKPPTLDEICARCSRYSGWKLTWSNAKGVLTIKDVDDTTADRRSWLILSLRADGSLSEGYGRLRHWAITFEEQAVLKKYIKLGLIPTHDFHPVKPVDEAPLPPRKADAIWRLEYAKYTAEYRMREGYSERCMWCRLEVIEWDTSYDGWNRCPHCGGN